jgi:pimeloyl-ACP methyl ester carboxylesterase
VTHRLRRAARPVAVLLLCGVLVAVVYLGWVALQRARPLSLPTPDGRYRVGRSELTWTDAARTDPLAPRPGTRRTLSVWIWYPAARNSIDSRAPYAPGAWAGLHLTGVAGFFEGRFDVVRGHALVEAPVAEGSFPIVVLEPGMGFAAPQYTALAEGLASHGYLVAGVTPTYSANLTVLGSGPVRSTPRGNPSDLGERTARAEADATRLVDLWAADARFVAAKVAGLANTGQFGDRIVPDRTAYIGHSFGGAAALQACSIDPHCVAAADLDGTPYGSVVRSGLRVAPLLMGSEDSCVTGSCRADSADDRADVATTRSLLAASTGPAWCYTIRGARHLDFSDYGSLYLARPLRTVLALGDIDGARSVRIQEDYLAAYLDHTTRGAPAGVLDSRTQRYPEVRTAPLCTSRS